MSLSILSWMFGKRVSCLVNVENGGSYSRSLIKGKY